MTDAPRKLMCVVELTVEDAVTVGMTLRSLAHTRLADASAAERLERVGAAMVAARATATARVCDGEHALPECADAKCWHHDPSDSWRAAALTAQARAARLEIELAMMKSAEARPLIVAAAAWAEAEKALALANAAATACEDALDAAKGDVEAKRRSDNASLWYITCVRDEEKAAQTMRNAAKRLAARAQFSTPPPDASILRIVLGDACVVAERIPVHFGQFQGWNFACQCCDLKWSQPDRGDATALEHMRVAHPVTSARAEATDAR